MRTSFFAIILMLFLSAEGFAVHVAVLETMADAEAKTLVSLSDRQYLTNVLREQAVNELPAVQNYTIMTRENISAMLPPGKAIEDCEGSCLAETGRNIAADYICQARVGSFGGALTLSAELYETAGNKLVASFNGRGANVNELLELIKEKAPDFFRNVKNSSGIAPVANTGAAGNFNYVGKKRFIVELTSTPVGAVPSIDGRGIPKCTKTPCKVQVEEGSHRIVMSRERYVDAETVVDIKMNNQKVELELEPNFGWLEIRPVLEGNVADKGDMEVLVDGNHVSKSKVRLDPGVHNVRVTHPCYDPTEFNVSIERNKTEVFDKTLVRGMGAMELETEYKGEPQAVALYIDGVESGSTPYAGEVPMCADVEVRSKDWSEKVNVTPKWHDVVQVTHKLKHSPEKVAIVEDPTRKRANEAYAELDGMDLRHLDKKTPSNTQVNKKSMGGKVLLCVGTIFAATGVMMAVIGDGKAKDAADRGGESIDDLKKNRDDAKTGQTVRGVGLGLAIAGAVGVGVSFAF